eukprot:6017914-Prymnesium_polylepis.1
MAPAIVAERAAQVFGASTAAPDSRCASRERGAGKDRRRALDGVLRRTSRERGAPQDGDLRRCEHRRHRGDDAGLVEARVAYADRDHLFLVDPRQPRGRRVAVLHPPRRQPCHARTTPRGGRAGCNVHMAKWLLTRPHGTWLHGTWHMAAQREREGWLPRAHIWPPPRGGRQPEHNAWLGRCGGSDAAVTAAVQQLLIVTALNATGAAGGVRPLRRG